MRRHLPSREPVADLTACSPDEALVAAARQGDLDAFNLLVERYQRTVFAICLRLLRDPQSAEDATQDAFIRAYGSLNQHRGGSFRAWLLQIATNRSYDILRREQRRPAESIDDQPVEQVPRWSTEPASTDPPHHATRAELSARLEQALGRLPEEQRLVVLLFDVHGYTYEEIAQITAISLGTVKSRLSRGRSRLREILRDDHRSRELLESVSRHLSEEAVE